MSNWNSVKQLCQTDCKCDSSQNSNGRNCFPRYTFILIYFLLIIPLAETQRRCEPHDVACEVLHLQSTVVSLERKFTEQQRVIDNLEAKISDLISQIHSGPGSQIVLPSSQAPLPSYQDIGVNGPDHGVIRPDPNRPFQPGSADDPNTWPKDCHDVWQRGDRRSKIHSFYNQGLRKKFTAYCNMSYEPWMVIFRHGMGRGLAFNRSWTDFREGFGDPSPSGSFWIGNELLHRLTYSRDYKLMIRVRHSPDLWCESEHNATKYATYDYVRVDPEQYRYALVVQSYTGNMGNILDCGDQQMRHNLMSFSTYDVDNDLWEWGRCAYSMGFGFWHNDCGAAKFGEKEPDYLNCDTNRWHYELADISISIARKEPLRRTDEMKGSE